MPLGTPWILISPLDQSTGLKEMFRRWMRWSLDKIAGSRVQQVIFSPRRVARSLASVYRGYSPLIMCYASRGFMLAVGWISRERSRLFCTVYRGYSPLITCYASRGGIFSLVRINGHNVVRCVLLFGNPFRSPEWPNEKFDRKVQISFCKMLNYKTEYHEEELLSSFHFNGRIVEFCRQTQKLEPPCTE